MKTLTVELSEDIYEQAERRAVAQGSTLSEQTTKLLREFATGQGESARTANGGDVSRQFAALDEARNTHSISTPDDQPLSAARAQMQELFRTVKGFRLGGRIPREELHERGSLR